MQTELASEVLHAEETLLRCHGVTMMQTTESSQGLNPGPVGCAHGD